MPDEGDVLLMAELIKDEKRLRARVAEAESRLAEPRRVLEQATSALEAARIHHGDAQALLGRFEAAHRMATDELAEVLSKKSDLRVESRVADGVGRRTGTAQLVNDLQAITGDDTEVAADRLHKEMSIEAELQAMKEAMDSED